jgi:hypothetical protein
MQRSHFIAIHHTPSSPSNGNLPAWAPHSRDSRTRFRGHRPCCAGMTEGMRMTNAGGNGAVPIRRPLPPPRHPRANGDLPTWAPHSEGSRARFRGHRPCYAGMTDFVPKAGRATQVSLHPISRVAERVGLLGLSLPSPLRGPPAAVQNRPRRFCRTRRGFSPTLFVPKADHTTQVSLHPISRVAERVGLLGLSLPSPLRGPPAAVQNRPRRFCRTRRPPVSG